MHSCIRAVLLHRLLKIVWPLLVIYYINSDTDDSNDIFYLIIFLNNKKDMTFY